MSLDDLAAMAEIIGGVAVIISLAYLAIQIRENARQTRLGSAIALNHLINEAFDPIYNNDRNIDIWTVGIADPSSLNEQDQAIFSLFMARLVNTLLTAFLHNDHKVLESEASERYIGSLKSILDSPGGKYWLAELGGDEMMSDWARNTLERSAHVQTFLTHGRGKVGERDV